MPIPNVYKCVGCGRLHMSDRTDCLTCSPACRVRAYRNGDLRRLRVLAEQADVSPGLLQRMKALQELCPHLGPRIMQSRPGARFTIDDAREEVWEALKARLRAHGLL
jgi:hypothetical protein